MTNGTDAMKTIISNRMTRENAVDRGAMISMSSATAGADPLHMTNRQSPVKARIPENAFFRSCPLGERARVMLVVR
jgi:hypothetical protein